MFVFLFFFVWFLHGVIRYNIRNGGNDKSDVSRQERLLRWMRDSAADVIGLCEANNWQQRRRVLQDTQGGCSGALCVCVCVCMYSACTVGSELCLYVVRLI